LRLVLRLNGHIRLNITSNKGIDEDMNALSIAATKFTPEILFDAEKNSLHIKGESYPENAGAFFNPLFQWIESYLDHSAGKNTVVNIELYYFNSSSSKMLMNMFELFDKAVGDGENIILNWIYKESDSDSIEFCEEFGEDLEHARFNLVEIP
jgi:hypothetical protein